MRRAIIATLLLASSCVSGSEAPGTSTSQPVTTHSGTAPPDSTTEATTTTTLPSCPSPIRRPSATTETVILDPSPVMAAISISASTFACSDTVVVAPPDRPRIAALGGLLAAEHRAPLLYGAPGSGSELSTEMERLSPHTVFVIGDTIQIPAGPQIERLPSDLAALAEAVDTRIGALATVALPESGPGVFEAAAAALDAGFGLTPARAVTSTTAPSSDSPASLPVIAGTATGGAVWVIDRAHLDVALAALAAGRASGGVVALVDGTDLRRSPELARILGEGGGPTAVNLLTPANPDAIWQMSVLARGSELPGGGYLMFDGWRLVALYGNPLTPLLGVLGEQGPEDAVARANDIAAPYWADGVPAVAGFELIATVADASPGPDGDYSNEMTLDLLRPWVDLAEREGLYVLLDLQPGRSDFLSQAMEYEELLRRPHVGLALDPEWRLGPDEFHLQTFGGVDAAEINTVVEWLAGIVRDEALPQKMLLLHQFRSSMLPDRELVEVPPELTIVVQMDGQGLVTDKYATWEVLTTQADSDRLRWGWKNFYDEDVPGPLTPGEVLELTPRVVYVSYQ